MSFDDLELQTIPSVSIDLLEDFSSLASPEHRLMVAVLERAILDCKNSDIRIRKEAEQWFQCGDSTCLENKDSMDYMFSYHNICMHLEIDSASWLSKITKWAAEVASKSQAS